MRQGELLGLRWSDVDLGGGEVRLQRQLQRITGQGLVFVELKTPKSRRSVALGPRMVEMLRAHRLRQERERAAREHWNDHDLVFPSRRGTPMGPRNLLFRFKALLQRAGLPDIRFHDLRHTSASLMLAQEINPKIVQERLGHASPLITLSTYSHVLPGMQRQAAAMIEELLTPIRADFSGGSVAAGESWQRLVDEFLAELSEWRDEHPDSESVLDDVLGRLRAGMRRRS
jgi:integrase